MLSNVAGTEQPFKQRSASDLHGVHELSEDSAEGVSSSLVVVTPVRKRLTMCVEVFFGVVIFEWEIRVIVYFNCTVIVGVVYTKVVKKKQKCTVFAITFPSLLFL